MPSKKKKYNLKSRIISALRQVSRFHPDNTKAKADARICRGLYLCNACKKAFKQIKVDHIYPVVNPEDGFIDWNTFIERLFPGYMHLQALCEACHNVKTTEEKQRRKKFKNEI